MILCHEMAFHIYCASFLYSSIGLQTKKIDCMFLFLQSIFFVKMMTLQPNPFTYFLVIINILFNS